MTRNSAAREPAPALSHSADDGWDMPPRREGQVMADMPKLFEPAEPDRPLMTGRGVLTPAEIQALLRPDLSDMPPEPEPPAAAAQSLEEFAAQPPRARREDHDTARRFAARLSMAMREHCGLPIAAAVAATGRGLFDAAVRQADEDRGQAIACFATRGGDIGAMLVLSPGLAQLLIETACGARERGGVPRPLSPIDIALLQALVRPLAQAVSPELGFSGIETELVFAASIAPPCEAMVTEFSMRMQTDMFRAQLIVTAAIAGPAAAEPAQVTVNAHPAQRALSATLTARVASLAVPLSRLSGLKPGATLLLGVPADQPIELISGGEGGVVAAEAEIGRRGGRVALRITRRGPALGPAIRA